MNDMFGAHAGLPQHRHDIGPSEICLGGDTFGHGTIAALVGLSGNSDETIFRRHFDALAIIRIVTQSRRFNLPTHKSLPYIPSNMSP